MFCAPMRGSLTIGGPESQERSFCSIGVIGRRSLYLVTWLLVILPSKTAAGAGSSGDDPIASMESGLDLAFAVGSTRQVVPRKASSDFHAAGAARPVVCDDGESRCFVPESAAHLCPIIYSDKALLTKDSHCPLSFVSNTASLHAPSAAVAARTTRCASLTKTFFLLSASLSPGRLAALSRASPSLAGLVFSPAAAQASIG